MPAVRGYPGNIGWVRTELPYQLWQTSFALRHGLAPRPRRAMTASSLPLGWDVVRLHQFERCAHKPGPIARSKLVMRDARRELYDIFCNIVGSILSPLLANTALHGLEEYIRTRFPARTRRNPEHPGRQLQWQPQVIRYADDRAPRRRGKEAALVT
jgi:hypothetical protein